MKTLLVSSLIGAISILGVVESAQALSIRGADSVTTTLGTFFGSPDAAINKAGLLTPYTNGQDLPTYLALDPKHTFVAVPGLEYFADPGVTSGNLDFNLGGIFEVSSLVLWNEDSQGIKDFKILTSNVANFSVSNVAGSFTGVKNLEDVNYSAQRYNFDPVNAQFVRLQILNAYANPTTPPGSVAVGEVAFGVNNVDTPPVPFEFSPTLGVAALGVVFGAKKFLKAKAAN